MADVSVEIKAGSSSSAEVILSQISALLEDNTAMSVSPCSHLQKAWLHSHIALQAENGFSYAVTRNHVVTCRT